MLPLTRPDLFTQTHKGIRLMLYELATDMQRTDFTEPLEESTIITRVLLCLDLLDEHGLYEDTAIFPAVQMKEPGALRAIAIDHEQLAGLSSGVKDRIEDLRDAMSPGKAREGALLLRAFNTLVAAQLNHMNREEESALPATWKHLTDEHILRIRASIQSQLHPERYRLWLGMMLRAMSIPELVILHAGMRQAASPSARVMFEDVAAGVLGEEAYRMMMSGPRVSADTPRA